MSAVEDIRIKLEHRLIVVEQEIESLRCALTALDDEQAARQTQAAGAEVPGIESAPAAPRRRGTRQRKAPTADGSSSAELERLLAETGGLTAVELARQTGTDYGVVLARIRQLEEAGRSRR